MMSLPCRRQVNMCLTFASPSTAGLGHTGSHVSLNTRRRLCLFVTKLQAQPKPRISLNPVRLNEISASHASPSKDVTDSTADIFLGFGDPEFTRAVSGEWFGYECAFSVPDGKPLNIPERYVPDEFRQWGVEINGFEVVTSSHCVQDNELLVKRTRALPSVGCEADAVVPEVSEEVFEGESATNVGFCDGSFACGPACFSKDHSHRWNMALVDPNGVKKSRVRVEFSLKDESFDALYMFLESWDAPFCNGEVLPGCGGQIQSFATDAVLQASEELVGKWSVETTVYTVERGTWRVKSLSSVVERTASNASEEVMVSLPRGVSVGVTSDVNDIKTVAVGWLTSDTSRIVCRRSYDGSGALHSVSLATERR